MKKIMQQGLASLSRAILKKYRPTVIGITGSVGKTSTRQAVFCVVSQKYRTAQSEKNYNNELGLPLTIIGIGAPGRNLFLWLGAFLKGLCLVLLPLRYPEVLVLEMGIDRPGDMDYLVSIAQPKLAIITSIGISHFEFFGDPEVYATEKAKIAGNLPENGALILNADEPKTSSLSAITTARVIRFGLSSSANAPISEITENLKDFKTSFSSKLNGRPFRAVIRAVGESHIMAASAAIAAAEALSIETDLVIRGLSEYRPAPGRLNVFSGIKKSLLIDDTYNAAPASTAAALRLLSRLPAAHKTAILGDMLELGTLSEKSHEDIGALAASSGIDRLVTVGPGGKQIARGAEKAGFPSSEITSFDSSPQALNGVQNMLVPGSAVLIKGSQGMRMEKITKEIMAQPMRAGELLCRQYGKWLES